MCFYVALLCVLASTMCMPRAQAVLRDKSDATEMRLVYANQTEEDILLRKELDEMAEDWRLTIHYILSRPAVSLYAWIRGGGLASN